MYSSKFEETCQIMTVQWPLSLWNKQFGFLEHLSCYWTKLLNIEIDVRLICMRSHRSALNFMHGMCDAVQEHGNLFFAILYIGYNVVLKNRVQKIKKK